MAVNKKAKDFYNSIFDGIETWCANTISNVQEYRLLSKYRTRKPIPRTFKKEVRQFWRKYTRVSPQWGWYYGACNGILDPRYIPNSLYYTKIDQHFNNRKLGWGFNDKNYYSLIFHGIKQPDTLVRKINGLLLNENYQQIALSEAVSLILEEKEVVCKPTLETGSGRGISFWNTMQDRSVIEKFLTDPNAKDYVVQKVIKQHPDLNRIHASSINTIRIMSLLMPDGVHVLSACLRMGVGDSKVDNVSAGGISCGIRGGGLLDKYAYSCYSGKRFVSHPQGFVFEGFQIPSFDNAIALVEKVHPWIPHFRLVSWDIAIDYLGESILIEANMRKGMVNLHQFSNGPLFGDLTEVVLDEVFNK